MMFVHAHADVHACKTLNPANVSGSFTVKELIDFLKPPNAGGESGDMLLQPLFADTAAGAGSAASLAGPSGSAHAVTGGAAGGSAPTFFGYNRHAGA